MIQRAIFGSIFVAFVLAGILLGLPYFTAAMFILMSFCTYEFLRLFKVKAKYIYAFSFLVNTAIFYASSKFLYENKAFNFLKIASFLILFLPCVSFIIEMYKDKLEDSVKDVSTLTLCAFYIAVPFALLMTMVQHKPGEYNYYLPLAIFIFIWCNDTFAYLTGRTFGKHKLFEKLSPKKTIEGFVGGLVFAIIAGILFEYFVDNSKSWFIIAIIVSIFGTIGDLIESMFKRRAGVKDSGNFIPGHGGFMDRLDSFIFSIPFIYMYLFMI